MFHSRKLLLPDLITPCPFIWNVHPEYERARDESVAWIHSFNVFADQKRISFSLNNVELLTAIVYSYANYDELRICCDFMNLFFLVDDLGDRLDGEETRTFGAVLTEALRGRYKEGSNLSKIGEDLRSRLMKTIKPRSFERLLKIFTEYIDAVSKESKLRNESEILHIDSYIHLRRENSGVRPCFALFEYVHGIELPDEVFGDPTFMRLYWDGVDLVWLANDLYSYGVERANCLDGNNYLTVAMRDKGFSLQQAADFTGDQINLYVNRFLESQKQLPSFGERVDIDVQKYIFSISQWHVGNLIWSFKTPRYFGEKRDEVKVNLVVDVEDSGNIRSEVSFCDCTLCHD